VSELELAVAEPPPPAPVNRLVTADTEQHLVYLNDSRPLTGAYLLSELFRRIAATQTAHEDEQRRRLAWEQEQEAQYAEKQAEMEKKKLEMSNELMSLRAVCNSLRKTNTRIVVSPVLQPQSNAGIQPGSSISPSPQPPFTPPMFTQGSSSLASIQPHQRSASPLVSSPFVPSPAAEAMAESIRPIVQYITPDPSLHLSFVETFSHQPEGLQSASTNGRRAFCPRMGIHLPVHRAQSQIVGGNAPTITTHEPSRHTNHHDTRCYTIHVSYLELLNAAL